ncbi:MAG: N-6 DNA methylase [Roseiflexaceae bacterium]
MAYTTIVTEGGLLPSDLLEAIVAGGELPGQRPEDFGLERNRGLTDEISAAWGDARSYWDSFQRGLKRLRSGDAGTSVTREQWILPLLRTLGYELVFNQQAYLVEGRSYAISHRAGQHGEAPPVHIEGINTRLDTRPPSGRPRLSPHALVQEYLNSTEQLWGIVTNGERLRLLRDSSRFTRPAYVEFDLRGMLEGEKFHEFALFYRLLHRSRLASTAAESSSCLLEQYHQRAVEAGGRVRDGLRGGVEQALKRLGSGLLSHPANAALRQKLAAGLRHGAGSAALTPLGYYRQLLRLVYRLLFLMVAEERQLIAADPDVDPQDDPLSPLAYRPSADRRLAIYQQHYSLARLRRLAEQPGTGRGPHGDLWLGLRTTFTLFEGSDEQLPRMLGLAALDGDLFAEAACADLTDATQLRNADLLQAIRALSLYHESESRALRRVNYGALDVEELGSVYESLLDYRPVVRGLEAAPLAAFDLVTGTERKTTGSYYTRPELVQELIKSALEPVLAERLRAVRERRPRAAALAAAEEQAILSIHVVDPAAGSGHFLLAAARRLGRELAKIRAGEDQPAPSEFRRAVRDVIQHCIFGVDLNPLAVDLCKLALWIEGHSAGLPLSFLDHHIRHGNSLIGATRALVAQGIPDDAYKAITGDEKKLSADLRKRNKRERGEAAAGVAQADMFASQPSGELLLAKELHELDQMQAESVAAVRAKASRYRQARSAAEAEFLRFNLWVSAFFQPLTSANMANIPTSADLDRVRLGDAKALQAEALADEVGFFHWELEFPHVFGSQGGFDVVLGNPPWERIKLQEQEHFVDVPAIAQATNKAAREKLIIEWGQGDAQQRARIAEFERAKYRAEAESRFVRASGRYPLTAVGDVNTYALFAEHSRTLLAAAGRAGVIVPTGIATDDSTKAFFGDVSQRNQLVSLYDFENREKIFADVDSRYKFSLLTIGTTSQPARLLFFATAIADLTDQQRQFSLSPAEIALINPNTRTAPIFRTNADAELTKAIYRRVPVLLNEQTKQNPWQVRFMTMFHMSNDSHLFHQQPAPDRLPLYEAKLLHQFSHRWATYSQDSSAELSTRDLTPAERADPTVAITPRYWVAADQIEARLAERQWPHGWLLGFRDIARATDERTAIFSLLPRVGVGNKIPIVFPDANASLTSCLLATVNSMTFDFVARQKVGGTSLNFFIVYQLPVLPPEAFSADDIAFIVPRVLELTYTAWDLRAFAEDVWAEASSNPALANEILRRNSACNHAADPALFAPRDGFVLAPFRWDDQRRAQIRAELDARIARLYGLTRDELRYILDPSDVYGPEFPGETFRVLKEKEIKQYGEYRTRRLVLAAWDADR